jgi:RNA polymerase sigma-70 factor (ECF subfamily)
MHNNAIAEAQFEAEAMPHVSAIYRTASRLTGAAAEDVTQEVFLRAWRSFDRFTPGTNCKAWLYRILFFTVSRHRRVERRHAATDAAEILDWVAAGPECAAEHLTDRELLRLLDELHPRHREVLLLVDVEEFSYRDAATVLRVPVGTVMSRLSRARRRMRDLMNGSRPTPEPAPAWTHLTAYRARTSEA